MHISSVISYKDFDASNEVNRHMISDPTKNMILIKCEVTIKHKVQGSVLRFLNATLTFRGSQIAYELHVKYCRAEGKVEGFYNRSFFLSSNIVKTIPRNEITITNTLLVTYI